MVLFESKMRSQRLSNDAIMTLFHPVGTLTKGSVGTDEILGR